MMKSDDLIAAIRQRMGMRFAWEVHELVTFQREFLAAIPSLIEMIDEMTIEQDTHLRAILGAKITAQLAHIRENPVAVGVPPITVSTT